MQTATQRQPIDQTNARIVKMHPGADNRPVIDVGLFLGTNVSASSARKYLIHWSEYLSFAGQQWDRPESLVQWRGHLVSATHDGAVYCASSINLRVTAVKSVVAYAADAGRIDRSIAYAFKTVKGVSELSLKDADGPARSKSNARTYIAPESMRRLVDAPDCSRASGMMHRALLMTLAQTGIRVAEACALRIDAIRWGSNDDGQEGWQVWIAGKRKVKATPRALGAGAKVAIDAWLERRAALGVESPFVFTSFGGRGDGRATSEPMQTVSAWRLVKRYSAAVGLKDIKPHDFRRFVGTQLARQDVRVAQKQLGHASLDTTVKNYILDQGLTKVTDDLF